MTRLYDTVKKILTDDAETRNSDKKLIWEVWDKLGLTDSYVTITKSNFMKAPAEESITRARRLIQARHYELRASKKVQEYRAAKEKSKGTFAYRETVRQDISAPVDVMMKLKEEFLKRGL